MIRTKALRLEQNTRVFYILSLSAGELVRNTTVDPWDPSDKDTKGYQRMPSAPRVKRVAKYVVRDDAIMPQGGLLNARSRDGSEHSSPVLEFDEEWSNGHLAAGWLTIPDNVLPLYVVDMQHRIAGYRHALEAHWDEDLEKFPLVVTVADGLPLNEEVSQFELINTTQMKVKTDLARRLLARKLKLPGGKGEIEDPKIWQARGAVIAAALAADETGPWYERIQPPNSTKKMFPRATIPETSFVSSLKLILKSPHFTTITEAAAADIIGRYWLAIVSLYKMAVISPGDYVLQKTTGVFAFNRIMPSVLELARARGDGSISVETIGTILGGVAETYGDDYWARKNDDGAAQYGSQKGFRILAEKLERELPDS